MLNFLKRVTHFKVCFEYDLQGLDALYIYMPALMNNFAEVGAPTC